jgi:hypothetical protein
MFLKLRKIDVLCVKIDFDNYFSGEKCLTERSQGDYAQRRKKQIHD